MAVFTILFGTRNIDANEHHHGVVAAIALEALVKLCALLAVGLFVVFSIAGSVTEVFAMPSAATVLQGPDTFGTRWVALTFLSATRSEAHTSELQSLMRISYAVFCLKKKSKNKEHLERQKQIR